MAAISRYLRQGTFIRRRSWRSIDMSSDSESYGDGPRDEPSIEPSAVPDWAWPVGFTVIAAFLIYKLVVAFRPPEQEDNPFNRPKRKPKEVKLDKEPNYLYRLARASEPTRDHYGEPIPQEGKESTVGHEAMKEASTQLRGRSLVGAYYGDPKGLDSKCIHLSTADQVVSTAKMYFKGVDDLILLKFSTAAIKKDENVKLKFEEAQPAPGVDVRGDAFPHVYPAERGQKVGLSWWNLKSCLKVPLGANGEHEFPPHAFDEDIVNADGL
jgi:uncharacterized protein (DUF952 family)